MATEIDKEWRKKEESLDEVIKKYPSLPPISLLQLDAHRRGVWYTDAALARVDSSIHQLSHYTRKDGLERTVPASITFLEGSHLVVAENMTYNSRDPYIIDVVDDKIVLVDQDKVLAEVSYWEKPKFFDKVTSRGTPMYEVVQARPQRYSVTMSHYCHFWTRPGEGCKYCSIGSGGVKFRGKDNDLFNARDLQETMQEVVREKGRFVGVILSGGSILSGSKLCEDELQGYIEALQILGSVFKTKKFPSQVNSTALDREQLERLYEQTGLTSYTTDLEVFNEEIYKWVCPGKAHFIPYNEWKKRLYDAVEIFGKGKVDTGIVSGVELAKPNGYQTEAEAIARDLEEAEEIASHGVLLKHDIWHVGADSIFFRQSTPSLDYYAQITKGFYEINQKYGLEADMDSYRKCGMHTNLNLDRI
ncbi:MAG: radical SAM protein [Acetatifactor sp.]